jgi:hypothetical protein
MSTLITRRGAAVLVAAGALLFGTLAVAPDASAATLYACVKKNGTPRVLTTKKPKCKKGESKLSWNLAGIGGKNGINGINGLNGLNGTNGTNGTNGKDLTSHTPLPSGESESGFYAAGSGETKVSSGEPKSGYVAQGISFSQPLAAALPANHVVYNTSGKTSTHCPGFGKADPGFVCLYESEGSGLSFYVARDFALNENAADKYGFAVFFAVNSPGFIAGSWTVTAP